MLHLLQHLGEHVGGWLYVIAGGLVFAESAVMIGVVFPGETALLVAGLVAHQGYIALGPMVAVAVTAAALGDSVGYELGRIWGPRLRSTRWLGQRLGARRWQTAQHFLDRHGGKAVLLGRFTAVLRALTPGVAGMAGLPYLRTFLPWNLAGAVAWGGGCVLLGYGFSASLSVLGHYLTWGPVLLIALIALAGLATAHHLTRRARPGSDTERAPRRRARRHPEVTRRGPR